MHLSLEPLVKKELNKILDAKIIFHVRHTRWVANLMPVRKKNGDIRLCIDFRNLNRASQKDNYHVPSMEHILQCIFGSEMLSLLDGLSGYNQVLVSNGDQLKTTFNTKWGTYAYRKMPFGLINVDITFQRAMDIDFRGLINRSVVVYMDDITLYSYRRRDHIYHLKQIFERCQRVDTIMRIQPTTNKRAMQSFCEKINFVRKFVSSFTEIMRPIQLMMKKDDVYRWSDEAKKSFQQIKEAITKAPILVSPNFDKEFLLYTFASDISYAAILTQKNNDDNEVPISYMSSNLQGAELNYPDVEKQGFAVFKTVKHFHPYLLKARNKVIVPHPAVRTLFVQKEMGEQRGNWITSLQEYDLEIKPAKIV
eukprot:PITA_20679